MPFQTAKLSVNWGDSFQLNELKTTIEMPNGKICAFCAVGENLVLFHHWLEHHCRLGVERIFIGTISNDTDLLSEVCRLCAKYGAKHIPIGDCYGDPHHGETESRRIMEYASDINPWDWMMWCDVDEFRSYPVPLKDVVHACEKQHIHAVPAAFLDRVGENGELVDLTDSPSIGEQFPIGCNLTSAILRASSHKISIRRWFVKTCIGEHFSETKAVIPVGKRSEYLVHHFKWSKGIIERLKHRYSHRLGKIVGDKYCNECLRFLESVSDDGRINLNIQGLSPRRFGAFSYP